MDYALLGKVIALCGLSEAIMDTLNFNFYGSVFKNLNPKWWHREESASNKQSDKGGVIGLLKKTVFVFTTDGWHLFKSLHTLLLFVMVCIIYHLSTSLISFSVLLLIGYTLKKICFEIGYNLIFRI